MDKELSAIEGMKCSMDDILVIGKDQAEHDHRLKQVLHRLVVRGLRWTLTSVYFPKAGCNTWDQILDNEGVRKDPSKVKDIVDMAEPKDVGDLRRFLGLVYHLMKVSPNLAEKRKLVRELFKKEYAWV